MSQAGAGAGVYNTTRQVGAVLGSAGIAVLMQARLTAELPRRRQGEPRPRRALPPALHAGVQRGDGAGVAAARRGAAAWASVAALCFARPRHLAPRAGPTCERRPQLITP